MLSLSSYHFLQHAHTHTHIKQYSLVSEFKASEPETLAECSICSWLWKHPHYGVPVWTKHRCDKMVVEIYSDMPSFCFIFFFVLPSDAFPIYDFLALVFIYSTFQSDVLRSFFYIPSQMFKFFAQNCSCLFGGFLLNSNTILPYIENVCLCWVLIFKLITVRHILFCNRPWLQLLWLASP